MLEDVVDLVLEAAREHLISLIEHEHLARTEAEAAARDHVVNAARGADDEVNTLTELVHVVADVGATDAGVGGDAHEVGEAGRDGADLDGELAGRGEDQSLRLLLRDIEGLEDGDGEGTSLTSTGLECRAENEDRSREQKRYTQR